MTFGIVCALLSAALVVCALVARRSRKSIGHDVSLLLFALLPPVIGNMIIILSSDVAVSTVGCLMYYIGMDLTVIALLRFTGTYCALNYQKSVWHKLVLGVVAVDVVQLLLNPVTGHAFALREITVDGSAYFALVPLAGQGFHRIVAYGIFLTSLVVFVVKCVRAPRIYLQRYFVIVLAMVVGGLWQSFYIFSGTPIDRSMIGFGVFGLAVFYFALYYKPFRLLDRMLSRIVSGLNDSVFFFDTDGTCIYMNDAARVLVGLGRDDAIPEGAMATVGERIGGWRYRYNSEWAEMRRVESDGEVRYLDLREQQLVDDRGRHVGASLTVRDATEDELKLQREKVLATHDRLTGLYNMDYLYERVADLLRQNPDVDYRVVGVDVKDFKIINDIYSKEVGDRVLRGIADRIRQFATPGEVFGRLTGDKFGFIVPVGEFKIEEVESVLHEQAFVDEGINYPVIMHMGVYDVDERDLEPSVMFDRAFMAIATIKNDFQKHVAFYGKEMRDTAIWNQSISGQLEEAIAQRQIRPYLQPMVNAQGKVEGAEVLVRWIHPIEGFLSPARFIPVFEANGMIARLDAFMWECACELLRDWQRRGIDLFLSVNISPKDFYFIDVYGTIRDLVDKYGIDPHRLRLEITETVMMSDLENRLKIIEDLRGDGFLVEMDDFGSGYSSLNMLKDIPVDVLKIDMMFLYKTKDQAKAETILQTIINLSGQLGIPSVTEGVETADQLDMLVNMGCELFQGYYFAKPMPVPDFEEQLLAA